jgi:16S rRNA A1518/A1519 N6-dimethyltransferase RsmA/KsgA/DIM1 with predicted DNA glycosylase/AP lyase activity
VALAHTRDCPIAILAPAAATRSTRKPVSPKETLIYDVGAHKGEDTRFYLAKGFSVVAIEASPELCASLQNEFPAYVKNGMLNILNAAVAEASGVGLDLDPTDVGVDAGIPG